jgi:hypothetical protein
VQIYKFCINGNADAGAHGEHKLRLDGKQYFPSSGYLSLREGSCHELSNTPWRQVPKWSSLDVGTEEVDDWSENDSTIAHLSSNDWYSPTCAIYEVKMARDFKSENDRSVCWNAGVEATNGKATINAGVTSCTEWTNPAESYIWLMKVKPLGCEDSHGSCAAWASWGECDANPNYMLPNCKDSCNNCGAWSDCEDSHGSCAVWASWGECNANPNYMLPNCKYSCNNCDRRVLTEEKEHVEQSLDTASPTPSPAPTGFLRSHSIGGLAPAPVVAPAPAPAPVPLN